MQNMKIISVLRIYNYADKQNVDVDRTKIDKSFIDACDNV